MRPGSAEKNTSDPTAPAGGLLPPVLVLGLGNALLRDDAVGLEILKALQEAGPWGGGVEFLDGGTQGLGLLGRLEGRRAVLILDAVSLGAAPGTVHVLHQEAILASAPPAGASSHEGNAGDLLRAAALLGALPPALALVGLEPATVRTGQGLSDEVASALGEAVEAASGILEEVLGRG